MKFRMIKTVVGLLVVSSLAQAQQASPSISLTGKASTEAYRLAMEDNMRRLNDRIVVADADQKQQLIQIKNQFQAACDDADYADEVISTKTEEGRSQIAFTCFEGYEANKGSSFVFEVNESEDSSTVTRVEVEKQVQKKKGSLKLLVRETVALTGAVLISGVSARKLFPGEDDKVKHAGVSAALASISTAALHYFFKISPKKAAWISFAGCGLIGVAKELYDKKHPERHDAEINDLKADLIGCTAGSVLMKVAIDL